MHGEVTDPDVDVFDREAVFIERHLAGPAAQFPGLKIVLEHVTTSKQGAEYVAAAGENTAATLTAHHLLYNRNALFAGGMRPHWYCLPVLKREEHRRALVAAATSGSGRLPRHRQRAARRLAEGARQRCAGCYTALHALELYAQAFDAAGRLDRLEGFASFHGADFYGLPRNAGTVTLQRRNWTVPEVLPFGEAEPQAAGGRRDAGVAARGRPGRHMTGGRTLFLIDADNVAVEVIEKALATRRLTARSTSSAALLG